MTSKTSLRPTQYSTWNSTPSDVCGNIRAVIVIHRCSMHDLSKVVMAFMRILLHLTQSEITSSKGCQYNLGFAEVYPYTSTVAFALSEDHLAADSS